MLALACLLCSTYSVDGQVSRRAKVKPQAAAKKTALCKSNNFSFLCPKGYEILLRGDDATGIFLARNSKFGYSLFVIAPKDAFDREKLISETTLTVLKTLYPKESMDYRWRDGEFYHQNPSSRFEVSRKQSLGFNGNQIVTVVYRQISFKDKNLIIGTVVHGLDTGEAAERDFDEDIWINSGACFDASAIIRRFTGEKPSDKFDVCTVTIEAEVESSLRAIN
ncbi:MAG: hypothetical protein M3384_07165 [Acidobacteriota bacterium]|nr:hypothetical protein [Acidobacteriota bacterium]